jgi:UDP-N-acetylmuramate dehydrogenase
MISLSDADLGPLNTFGLPSQCSEVRLWSDPDELVRYLSSLSVDERARVNISGELSNTVLGETIEGPLFLFRDGHIYDIWTTADFVLVRVAGSCRFDSLVAELCKAGIAGFELLSGIPGTVGAAIVQNIAAYGQRISNRVLSVRVYDTQIATVRTINPAALNFSYRSSSLKTADSYTPPMIVLDAVFQFPRDAPPDEIEYEDLRRHHIECGRSPDDLLARRATVLEVRQRKGMVVDQHNWVPSAGSFFISPVVPKDTALHLATLVRGANFAESFFSWYRPDANVTRFPAALLMRAAGFLNGDRWGPVGLSPHHVVALCAYAGASGSDVMTLASLVQAQIRERFEVILEPEVRLLGSLARRDLRLFLERHHFVPGEGEPGWALGLGTPDSPSSS